MGIGRGFVLGLFNGMWQWDFSMGLNWWDSMEHDLDFSGISWDLSSGNLLHNYGKWPYKVDFNGIVQWEIHWIFIGFPLDNSWDLMGNLMGNQQDLCNGKSMGFPSDWMGI